MVNFIKHYKLEGPYYEHMTELCPFVCFFHVYTDLVGVCGSLEYRERSVAVGGDVHSCSAELCPGLLLSLPTV